MNMNLKYTIYGAVMAITMGGFTSCIDEESPTDQITTAQVVSDVSTQKNVLYGIAAYMVKYNAYGSTGYYYYDWGYPNEMFFRDLCTQDFVYSKNGTLNYWSYKENASSSGYEVYRWNYYYRLIKNCNGLVNIIDESTASAESKQYLAQALLFRAMAYMDLAREFEFKPTGYASLDAKAEANDIWGLTVPIVTEDMDVDDIQNNKRAPFFTMYRFIMTDLQKAKQLLGDEFTSRDCSLPDSYVADGLMARAWLEIGSRMDANIEKASQLSNYGSKISEYDAIDNGYVKLGVTSAADCYKKAAECAVAVIPHYSITTKDEWTDRKTGFNTATSSWMWRCRIGDISQEPSYYFSFPGTVCSEALSGLPYAYNAYRCISNTLFEQIGAKDWRKLSWISPDDAGKASSEMVSKYNSLLDNSQFSNLDAYANLKFRPGQGDISVTSNWMIGDLPLMRVEEMYYIAAEAYARIGETGLAESMLDTVMKARYTDGSYTSDASDIDYFIKELIREKTIEFWGEGLTYFDYKRLNLKIDRTEVSNTLEQNQISSKENYCAPWLNFFIYTSETNRNKACVANPDPSGYTEQSGK